MLYLLSAKARKERRDNYMKLRALCDRVGWEFEQKEAEELLTLSEEGFDYPDTECEGYKVSFSGEAREHEDGRVEYTLDLHSAMPTILGVKPSYHFYKNTDGTVGY